MPLRSTILKNPDWDQQLWDYGYAVIPFLNRNEIEELKAFYWECHPEKEEGFFSSAHRPDPVFRDKVNKGVKSVFERATQQNFAGCRTLGGSFIAKGPGETGHLEPHQDWNIVNESEHRSFNIWVPLVDVDGNNGAVSVLEKSHNWLPTFRGANIQCAFHKTYALLWQHMKLLEMNAGEALVYDHRLLHGSHPNYSEAMRMVAVYGIIPENASMHYYYAENGHIAEYDCYPEFYINENPFAGPAELKKVRTIDYDFPELSEVEVANFLGIELDKPKKKSIWNTISGIFR